MSARNVLRDETIWSYLAYLRETEIASCMAKAGFDYAIDLQYPRAQLLQVLGQLDDIPAGPGTFSSFQAGKSPVSFTADGAVKASHVGLADATAWNEHAKEEAKRAGSLDAYFMTLYGVTALELAKGDGNAGCWGAAGDKYPSNWSMREQVLAEQSAILRPARERAVGKCAGSHGLSASNPGDLEVAAEDAGDLAIAEECLVEWDRAAIEARTSKEFGEFVERVERQYSEEVTRLNEFYKKAFRDQGFTQLLYSVGDAPKIPFPGDNAALDADGGDPVVEFVPLDEPPIERSKDAPPPAVPPARAFLDDVPSVLALEYGPGMPEDHPNLELFWNGQEIGATAAFAHEDAFSDSDGIAFVVFSCGEYELQITGPLDPGDLVNPQWLPVDPELIELILMSYGDECRLR